MPIRIKCPKCQTILGVKDSLAGKKASCPKCRGVLTIPMPKAPVAQPQDAEALALSALADEAPKPEAFVALPIEFECPFCMEMVKVAADMGGKQAPCPNPECKRIIKVPLPKKDKLKDWRQADQRGAAAGLMKNNDVEPEGTWSTAQKSRVSTEALLEAKAIPIKKRPVTTATLVRRGLLAFVGLVVLAGGTWGTLAWMANNRLDAPLKAALAQADVLRPAPSADIHCGVATCYILRNKLNDAMVNFTKARNKWTRPDDKTPADAERDTVLIELALAQIDLAGTDQEVKDETRLDWEKVSMELSRTLANVSSVEAKQTAVRELATKLIARRQLDLAMGLAESLLPQETPVSEETPPPPPPVMNDKQPPPDQDQIKPPDDAKKATEGNKKMSAPVVRSPLYAPRIALLVGTDQATDAANILPAPDDKSEDAEIDPVARLSYAEGKARQGNFEAAQKLAGHKGPALHRLEASIAVAAIALGQMKAGPAKASAQDAFKAFKELEKTKAPDWLIIQLTRVCARAGLREEVTTHVVGRMSDENIKALAQLELLKAHLEENSAKTVPATTVDEFVAGKNSLAYSLALESVAYHNTRLGGRSDALALLQGLDANQQAFVQIGIARALHEAK